MVARTRLERRLARSAEGPFTLVAAPAGGLAPRRRAVWTLIADALGAAAPQLAGLSIPGSGRIEPTLADLRARLDDLDEPVVLVLDDFHEVGTAALGSDLEHLLALPSPMLRLVVLTRRDPLMRLQRMRIGGTMTELRMRDLAMTEDEATALLEACDASITHHDAATLWRRTEGWAAGLRLAGLALRDHADPPAFVAAFAGDDAAVADYLVEEVLSGQPEAGREFLLRTSIVDEVSGELADVITGGKGGDDALHRLAHDGAMVTVLERPRGFYRFHPLLRDLLRARLRHEYRGEVARLHRRAATWLAAHGDVQTALRHALASGDRALSSRIAADGWIGVYLEGCVRELHALVDELPADAMHRDPELALAVAASRAEEGNVAQADEALAAAEAGAGSVPPEHHARFTATLGIVVMRLSRLHGDLPAALDRARRLIDDDELRHVKPRGLRALALANLGIAELWIGDQDAAARDLEAAAAAGAETGVPYVTALARAHQAMLASFTGRMRLASGRAQHAIDIIEEHGFGRTSAAAAAYVSRGVVEFAASEVDEAERSLRTAADALVVAPERALRGVLAVTQSMVLAVRGEPDAALAQLRLAKLEVGDALPVLVEDVLVAHEGSLLQALGEPVQAVELLERRIASHDGPDVRVSLARLRLAAGHVDEALALLEPVMGMPATATVRVGALATEAIARDALLDHDGAARAIEEALEYAEPRGVRRPFLSIGAPLRPVLRRQIRRETRHRALVAELLDALDRSRDSGMHQDAQLLDPLSERELTVLRYLPTMMSNTEIAAELFVSVNTVKTHLKQIYRKLDVTSRRDAVARARGLQLLAPGRTES